MSSKSSDLDIVIERLLDAPRELVYQAFTEAERVADWWGPVGFATRVEALDLRVGGKWRYVMVGDDGTEYPSSGVFGEIMPAFKLTTTDEFDHNHDYDDHTDLPQGVVVTMLFVNAGKKTNLTLQITHPTAHDKQLHQEMGVVEGWQSSLDCLEDHLDAMMADDK